jgi:hypothetical protein
MRAQRSISRCFSDNVDGPRGVSHDVTASEDWTMASHVDRACHVGHVVEMTGKFFR